MNWSSSQLENMVSVLSPRQQDVLVTMLDSPLDESGYQGISKVCNSPTLEALQQKGLVRWFPHGKTISYGLEVKGIWKLTRAGRKLAWKLIKAEANA